MHPPQVEALSVAYDGAPIALASAVGVAIGEPFTVLPIRPEDILKAIKRRGEHA